MDRAEPFSFPASPTALLRSRAIARAALLCLLLAALPTLAQAGTVVDSMKVNVTGGQRIGTLESDLIQLIDGCGGRTPEQALPSRR
ncbi:hypothetical protein [Aminobacter aminovorans]|uniref:hypothetical protein n=1 Tax=Aminobacter aminovorans TaxID=83263 RepID=UPI00286673D8|nr:hypothetical protein [Aminobacter aminovorans]MDR7223476.1 hypothetical protein [Aminobacter aminovorans]